MILNDKTSWIEEELEKAKEDINAEAYDYILNFSEDILTILDKKEIKNKNKYLAGKLGTSAAYISKLFNGKANFTVKTMIQLARAVDYNLKISLQPKLVAVELSPVYSLSVNTSGNLVGVPNVSGLQSETVIVGSSSKINSDANFEEVA